MKRREFITLLARRRGRLLRAGHNNPSPRLPAFSFPSPPRFMTSAVSPGQCGRTAGP
jgi:hypothetical protein